MAGDESERLRRLEARLSGAKRAEPGAAVQTRGNFSQGEVAWRMVIELVSGLVIGLAIGFGLDAALGTRPVFLVIFVLVGFAAGVRVMMRTANDMTARAEAEARRKVEERNGG